MTPRHQQLIKIYRAALAAVAGDTCVSHALAGQPWQGALLAIGKAAPAMALGALGDKPPQAPALVVTGREYLGDKTLPAGVACLFGSHPVPDRASLEAGAAVVRFLDGLPAGMPLLVLLSGGSSSMVEQLPAGLTLADLQRANRWLLGSGLAIGEMNRVRRALSTLKAGRLALRLGERATRLLLLSDVPGDHPRDIGSGPFSPLPAGRRGLPDGLPGWLRELAHRAPPPPAPHHPAFARISSRIVASNRLALEAAMAHAQALALPVTLHRRFLAGEAVAEGDRLARYLRRAPRGVHLWGGEPKVVLPANPGRGGRCQQLALAAARVLVGRTDCLLLAAGSDGVDGENGEARSAAGALVDGTTAARAQELGMSVGQALARADAGTLLAATGVLLPGGATGSNVMDLIIAARW